MKKAVIPCAIITLLACSLLVGCTGKELRGESDDRLSKVTSEPQVTDDKTLGVFSDSEAGQLLAQHINTAFDYSPGAIRRELLSLEQLKSQDEILKQQMVSELVDAYYGLDEGNYGVRWLVADLLAQLEFEGTLEDLAKLSLAVIPSETMIDDHHLSSREEEVAIRLASVHGVVLLARNGHRPAEEWLIRIAEASPVRSVKIQAVHGYLLAPIGKTKPKSFAAYESSELYESRLTELQKRLPAEIFALTEIKPASVENLAVPEDVLKSVEEADKKEAETPATSAPSVPKTAKPEEQG